MDIQTQKSYTKKKKIGVILGALNVRLLIPFVLLFTHYEFRSLWYIILMWSICIHWMMFVIVKKKIYKIGHEIIVCIEFAIKWGHKKKIWKKLAASKFHHIKKRISIERGCDWIRSASELLEIKHNIPLNLQYSKNRHRTTVGKGKCKASGINEKFLPLDSLDDNEKRILSFFCIWK